jgi:protein-disulfide isomerase
MNNSQSFSFAERYLLVVLVISSAALVAASRFYKNSVNDLGHQLRVSTSTVVGLPDEQYGAGGPRYMLVEFGDCQCPYCRSANSNVKIAMSIYSGKMGYVFRDFPLVRIHKYALRAAELGEIARCQNEFWPVHDYLMQATLCPTSLEYATLRWHLSKGESTEAQHKVITDYRCGMSIGVQHTPTFMLCCPGNKVFEIQSLDRLKNYIR